MTFDHSRISCKWNHTGCPIYVCLLSHSIFLRFIHLVACLSRSYILSINSVLLYKYRAVNLSTLLWWVSGLFPIWPIMKKLLQTFFYETFHTHVFISLRQIPMSRIARSGAQWCAGADWYWSARGKCAHLSPTPLSVMSDRQLEIGPGESIYTKEVIQVPQIRLVFFYPRSQLNI